MASRDVIRIPVDNDPAVRRDIIPALMARYIAEVGPVPLGISGEPSMSAVVRWALTLAAATAAAPTPVATNVDGARLKSAREAAGLSQQALADLLCYRERSAVSLAERGRAPLSPSMAMWLRGQG